VNNGVLASLATSPDVADSFGIGTTSVPAGLVAAGGALIFGGLWRLWRLPEPGDAPSAPVR
jgi:hypothetical protein